MLAVNLLGSYNFWFSDKLRCDVLTTIHRSRHNLHPSRHRVVYFRNLDMCKCLEPEAETGSGAGASLDFPGKPLELNQTNEWNLFVGYGDRVHGSSSRRPSSIVSLELVPPTGRTPHGSYSTSPR